MHGGGTGAGKYGERGCCDCMETGGGGWKT